MTPSMPDAPDAFLEHTAFVRSVARAALQGDDLVDDVVQETMITALEESQSRRGSLRAWLAGVARNKAHNLIRRRTSNRRREERVARGEATDGVYDLVERAEEGRRLVAAVLSLDELYKRPVLLRYYEGLPPREIARRLEVPVETARTRVRRGIEQLREALGDAPEKRRGTWRVALLPLVRDPQASRAAPGLIAGGGIVGKKVMAWALVLVVVVGTGLWLRSWVEVRREKEPEPHGEASSGDLERGRPHLSASDPNDAERAGVGPALIDMTQVDRSRDLHGWVVDTEGAPVPGASVGALTYPWRTLGAVTSHERHIESIAGPSTVSAPDGSFRISLERDRLVNVRVSAPGFPVTEWAYLQAGERITLVLGEPTRLVVVATHDDEEPVEGLPIRFFVDPERTGKWIDKTVSTDAAGRAVFDGLPGGLKGLLHPHPHRAGLGDPGLLEIELPTRGELIRRIALPAGKTLRGRVVSSPTNEPIEGAYVSTNRAFVPAVRTDRHGDYEVYGWAGQAGTTLHVGAPGFVHGSVEVNGEVVPAVKLQPGHTLRGRIVDAQRKPIARALVSVRETAGTSRKTHTPRSAVSNDDGEFVLRGVGWTPQALVAHRPGYGRLLRVVQGHGRQEDLGDLTLQPPCTVRGKITDSSGAPLPRTPVTLTPVNDLRRTLRRLERWTDDLGRFSFPDLEAGSFRLKVGSRFEPLLQQRVEVTLEHPTVDLRLETSRTRTVEIQVLDTEGRPAAGVLLMATSNQPPDRKQGKTDEHGTVALELLRGSYHITVLPTMGLPFVRPAPVAIDTTQSRVELELERLVPIRGRVLLPSGEPIARGFVRIGVDGRYASTVLTDEAGAFVAQVSASASVSLRFEGDFQDPKSGKHGFLPCRGFLDGVAPGSTGIVVQTTRIDTDRELSVLLLDPSGQPVEGVTLLVYVPGNVSLSAKTGPDGLAHWSALPAVPLAPIVRFRPSSTRDRPWLDPVFQRVTPVGQEITARFRAGIAREGRVEEEDGTAVAHALVQVLQDENFVRTTQSAGDGSFTAILDPEFKGTVKLRCAVPAALRKQGLSAVSEVEVKPGLDPIVLRLKSSR